MQTATIVPMTLNEAADYIALITNECAALKALADQQEARARRAETEVQHLRILMRLERIEKYGPRSEQLNDKQLELLEMEPGVSPAEIQIEADLSNADPLPEVTPAPAHQKKRRRGESTLPAHLPRQTIYIACDEADCTCPNCGGERKVIGHETTERLDIIPATKVVQVITREKRACPNCPEEGVVTVAGPTHIIEKGIGTNELVVDVILNKYEMHLPLYRQEAAFARESGIGLSRQTMSGWVMHCGFLLQAVTACMRDELLCGDYIQADETPIGVLDPKKKGSNHRGYLWEYSRPRAGVVFDYRDGRGREGPKAFLGDFCGVLQTDGYNVYASGVGGEAITLAACMAHVRRKFHEALLIDSRDTRLAHILNVIGSLYEVEARCRTLELGGEERLERRKGESAPLFEQLHAAIKNLQAQVLPRSPAGKACSYALVLWPRLMLQLRRL